MGLAIYMDVHVPRSITVGLRARGIDVLISQTDGTGEYEDSDLLDRAMELGRILFSRDDDLLREAASRQREGRPFASVAYAHQLKYRLGSVFPILNSLPREEPIRIFVVRCSSCRFPWSS